MKTVLVGNGLSIAYNRCLLGTELLSAVTASLAALGTATEVEATLSGLAQSLTPAAGSDLESLLGPLDVLGGAVGHLGALAQLTAFTPRPTLDAVTRVQQFTEGTYRTATSHVLEAIAAGSRHGAYEVITQFAEEILGSADRVSVATLNYDGLLSSGVLGNTGVVDLAAGYERVTEVVVSGQPSLDGYRLRRRDDLHPGSEYTELIQLHGSLGWLERAGEFVKYDIQDLRDQSYWSAWRSKGTGWSPAVVLTNQQVKSLRVLEYPYQLAYAIFEDRLRGSSHWLIAGYAFGDEAVNATIARAAAYRQSRSLPTGCLVITVDPNISPQLLTGKLGLKAPEITVCHDGFPLAFQGADWRSWKTS